MTDVLQLQTPEPEPTPDETKGSITSFFLCTNSNLSRVCLGW